MKDSFKEKVQSMTAKEIIMAMVEGLRKPKLSVDMSTFGEVRDGICFGCAATNAVCEIAETSFTPTALTEGTEAEEIGTDPRFLFQLELAFDQLRSGNISNYNVYATRYGFAEIARNGLFPPSLGNDYTEADLAAYVALAEAQD